MEQDLSREEIVAVSALLWCRACRQQSPVKVRRFQQLGRYNGDLMLFDALVPVCPACGSYDVLAPTVEDFNNKLLKRAWEREHDAGE